jgi:tRNA pseudouridine13 synthase
VTEPAARRLPRRFEPDDFFVEEIPLYAPSGEGGHTFVWIEKRLRTTEEIARALARAAGVGPGDVGYAGRKDRSAVARQWLSVPGLDPAAALALDIPGARVLDARRHGHKLRTGQLRANRFRIVVRDLDPAAIEGAPERAAELARIGLANGYGAQRFGAAGDNAERAQGLLASGGQWPRDRRAARFLFSSLQSAVFDAVLAQRPLPLDAVEAGDVAQVCASGGTFVVEDVAREGPRAKAFEISATGPIFGTRTTQATGAPGERERAAAAAFGIDLERFAPPRGIRARGARRPLRVRPVDLALEPAGERVLAIAVELPAGTYATVLIDALVGPSLG